jgi:hypothetical protein
MPAEWDTWAPFSIRLSDLWYRIAKMGRFEAASLHPNSTEAAELVMVGVETHQQRHWTRDMGPSTAALLFHPGKTAGIVEPGNAEFTSAPMSVSEAVCDGEITSAASYH